MRTRLLSYFSNLSPLFSIGLISCYFFIAACSENAEHTENKIKMNSATQENITTTISPPEILENKETSEADTKARNYELSQKNINYGRATLSDVYNVLTQRDVGALTNTVHSLYNMRWHRGVYHVLYDLWNNEKDKHSEFSWDLIQKVPVRIALASTINRIQIINTDEYVEYIRLHKEDEHEFHRAQVVIALGFNGELKDIEYIKSMADGNNHYVAQSAITALALMENNKARDAMAELWKKYRETEKGAMIKELMKAAYKVEPSLTPPKNK